MVLVTHRYCTFSIRLIRSPPYILSSLSKRVTSREGGGLNFGQFLVAPGVSDSDVVSSSDDLDRPPPWAAEELFLALPEDLA